MNLAGNLLCTPSSVSRRGDRRLALPVLGLLLSRTPGLQIQRLGTPWRKMEQCLQCFNSKVYVDKLRCANGTLKARSRVQVQFKLRHGGDNLWYLGTVQAMTDANMVEISLDRVQSGTNAWPDAEGVNARDVYLLPADSPGQQKHSSVGVLQQGDYQDSYDVWRKKELWDGGGVKG